MNRPDELRALKENWDSYGGKPITEDAIQAAMAVMFAVPVMTPCSNGGVQLDWPNGVEITFKPDGTQEFD